MSTIGHHHLGSTRDAYPTRCDICGVAWPRYKLRRDGCGLLICPDEGDGLDRNTLDRLNLQGARRRGPSPTDAPVFHETPSTDKVFANILGPLYLCEYRATDPDIFVIDGGVDDWPGMNGSDHARAANASRRPSLDMTGFNGGPCVVSSNTVSVQGLLTTLSRPPTLALRPYFWVVFSRVGAGAGFEQVVGLRASGTNFGFEFIYNTSKYQFRRSDTTGAGSPDDTGVATDTNRHLFAGGLTAGGIAAGVLDGIPYSSVRTGKTIAVETNFEMFSQGGSLGSNTKIAFSLLASDMPSDQQKTDVVAAITDNMWPDYNNSSFGLTVAP